MNFDLTEEQEMMRENFARFLDDNSSPARVRKAIETGGFDAALWSGLAELGALAMRVPEQAGGMGMGLFDAVVLMEEADEPSETGFLAELGYVIAAFERGRFVPGRRGRRNSFF
ncbi:MAG: acyl-CoA dehydrogenase family protein, partial [Novosphingobium sp.]|nr:acyl-CoA dehydrogenase family protein [Novosphingobium sp.]